MVVMLSAHLSAYHGNNTTISHCTNFSSNYSTLEVWKKSRFLLIIWPHLMHNRTATCSWAWLVSSHLETIHGMPKLGRKMQRFPFFGNKKKWNYQATPNNGLRGTSAQNVNQFTVISSAFLKRERYRKRSMVMSANAVSKTEVWTKLSDGLIRYLSSVPLEIEIDGKVNAQLDKYLILSVSILLEVLSAAWAVARKEHECHIDIE